MTFSRGDKAVLLLLLLLAGLCFGLPRAWNRWGDPLEGVRARWYLDVVQGNTSSGEAMIAKRWVDAHGTPLPVGPRHGYIARRLPQLPEPFLSRSLSAEESEEAAELFRIDRVRGVRQVAYESEPALLPDGWGRPWVLAFHVVELDTGEWWWESMGGGTVYTRGADGEFEWGQGDDLAASFRSGTYPMRSYWALFWLFALPLIVAHLGIKASRLPQRGVGRELLMSAFQAAPGWGVLLFLRLAFPRLYRVAGDFKSLPLLVAPSTAFFLTLGGLLWAAVFGWRLRRLQSAQEPAPVALEAISPAEENQNQTPTSGESP